MSGRTSSYKDITEGNTTTRVDVTRKGRYPSDNTGPNRSEGEVPGAGTIHAAALVERPNKSNNRNKGPDRPGSRSAATSIPIQTMGGRATGRITGSD